MERGIIKWRPFNSVINTKEMLNECVNKTNTITMPILSEDQITLLENKIIFSYYSKKIVTVKYYRNGKIYNITGIIKKIDSITHTINLNNTTILFKQIITIH